MDTSGRGEDIRKGGKRANIVEILYVHMYVSRKMRSAETIPEIWGGEIEENYGGVSSTMIYYKKFCKCHNILPVQQ
jgi:hypothetical protein